MLLLLQNVRKGDGKNCREEDGGLKESPENIDEEILNPHCADEGRSNCASGLDVRLCV